METEHTMKKQESHYNNTIFGKRKLIFLAGLSGIVAFIIVIKLKPITNLSLSFTPTNSSKLSVKNISKVLDQGIHEIKTLSISSEPTLLPTSTQKDTKTKEEKYLINAGDCKIPDFDPFNKKIISYVFPGKYLSCNRGKSFSYQSEDSLFINWTVIETMKKKLDVAYCRIRGIIRPVNKKTNHNSWKYLNLGPSFNNSVKVTDEFVNLRCYDRHDRLKLENFHEFVFEKKTVEEECINRFKNRQTSKGAPNESINVIMIGMDSTSRLNSARFMAKTRDIILNKMDGVEMFGHTKVGDNTFENLTPMLTGRFVHELPWSEKHETVFDNFDFIWKHYSQNGYRTFYTEDSTSGATFDYVKPGFHANPTDYYDRHFHLSMSGKYYSDFDQCFLDYSQTEVILNYTYRFVSKFKAKQYFGLAFITYLTHDSMLYAAAADDIYASFLHKITKNRLFNNTIFFFFGDHGYRYGGFRNTLQGSIEDRMPMMYITLPKWFSKKYPNVLKNLRLNSRRLTSHFDIHETLMDILYLGGTRNSKPFKPGRGFSLISSVIPINRTCENAGVNKHLCPCLSMTKDNIHNPIVIEAAKYLVKHINSKLDAARQLCATLKLEKITEAYIMDRMSTHRRITVMVTPGAGIFEGTVVHDQNKNSFRVIDDISRINSYSHQKRCAVDYKLELMCYCRDQTR